MWERSEAQEHGAVLRFQTGPVQETRAEAEKGIADAFAEDPIGRVKRAAATARRVKQEEKRQATASIARPTLWQRLSHALCGKTEQRAASSRVEPSGNDGMSVTDSQLPPSFVPLRQVAPTEVEMAAAVPLQTLVEQFESGEEIWAAKAVLSHCGGDALPTPLSTGQLMMLYAVADRLRVARVVEFCVVVLCKRPLEGWSPVAIGLLLKQRLGAQPLLDLRQSVMRNLLDRYSSAARVFEARAAAGQLYRQFLSLPWEAIELIVGRVWKPIIVALDNDASSAGGDVASVRAQQKERVAIETVYADWWAIRK